MPSSFDVTYLNETSRSENGPEGVQAVLGLAELFSPGSGGNCSAKVPKVE